MPKRCAALIVPLVLAVLLLPGLHRTDAAELAFVLGSIVSPEHVNEGDDLTPGTTVQSGSDALVIVEHRWPSEVKSRDCIHLVIFGYGERYVVSDPGTPGRCETTVPANPADLPAGRPFLSRETRYGDAKFDEPSVPASVASSQARWRGFDTWLRSSRRSFTGIVSSVSVSTIRIRSQSSRKEVAFALTAATDSPMPPDRLLKAQVRVDYERAGAGNPRAVSIVVRNGGSRPDTPDGPGRTEPGGERGGRVTPEPGRTSGPAEAWSCAIDLHQGDTGTLLVDRAGSQVSGTLSVARTPGGHAISGSWEDDRITFWRALSESSGQPFVGVAVAASGGRMRLAGRFAADHAGVWSADCVRRGASDASPPAGSGPVDVVLTAVGPDRIAVIREVRAVTGLGLRDVASALETLPFTVRSAVTGQDASEIAVRLRNAGASVSLRPSR